MQQKSTAQRIGTCLGCFCVFKVHSCLSVNTPSSDPIVSLSTAAFSPVQPVYNRLISLQQFLLKLFSSFFLPGLLCRYFFNSSPKNNTNRGHVSGTKNRGLHCSVCSCKKIYHVFLNSFFAAVFE